MNLALFLLVQAAYCMGAYGFLRRYADKGWSYLVVWLVYPCFTIAVLIFLATSFMNVLMLMSYSMFLFGVVLLATCAYHSRKHFKIFPVLFASAAAMLMFIAIEGFVIEPHWLTIRRESMTTTKLRRPLKIAVIADLQTDDICNYDYEALMHVKHYSPDIVLFAGDYINVYNETRAQQVQLLNDLLKRVEFSPSIGVFVVKGDIDPPKVWADCFKDLPYQITETSKTGKFGDIVVTQLSLPDSRNCQYKFNKTDEFHIALGHAPDYALTKPPVDLIVAGHTHGGQVQIPYVGPVITLSSVPPEWGGGCMTDIGNGTMLCISRGVGMERGEAPRIRFFCRPELVFIDVLPK